MNAMGEFLRTQRARLKLSRRELSRMTGISYQSLSNYENAASCLPGTERLATLAAALQVERGRLEALKLQVNQERAQPPLARFVRERRQALYPSTAAFARHLGVPSRWYSRIERGTVVQIPEQLIEAFAMALACSPQELTERLPEHSRSFQDGIMPEVRHHREKEPNCDLGTTIRYARKKLGLTQAQLGTLMGVAPTTVSKLEREGWPELRNSFDPKALAAALQIPFASIEGLLPPRARVARPRKPATKRQPKDMTNAWEVGQRIRTERHARNLTLEQAAQAAGISAGTWWKTETRTKPPTHSLGSTHKILKSLGMELIPLLQFFVS